MSISQISNYLIQIRDVNESKLWMGPNFKTKIQDVGEDLAFQPPVIGVHCIAEIIAHMTAWQKDASLKIKHGRGKLLDSDPENWKTIEELKTNGWKNLLNEYQASLTELLELIKNENDEFLDRAYYDIDFKSHFPYRFMVEGILHHSIYHLGQIGLILKIIKISSQ